MKNLFSTQSAKTQKQTHKFIFIGNVLDGDFPVDPKAVDPEKPNTDPDWDVRKELARHGLLENTQSTSQKVDDQLTAGDPWGGHYAD